MEQKYIAVNGLNLAYLEKNAEAAQIIFFIHGNSGSSLTWSKQLESYLLAGYRLIAFDLPAHGFSAASPDPDNDYSPLRLGEIMAEAVDRLAKDQSYILAGFSLGTNIIGEMLRCDLTPSGIVLVSSCVIRTVNDLEDVFLPNENANNFFNDSVSDEGLDKLARDCFYLADSGSLETFKSDFHKTKSPFRSTLIRKAGQGAIGDEIESIKKMHVSPLIIFGKQDKIVNVDYLDKWGITKTIHKLEAAGHCAHVDQFEQLNQMLHDYIKTLENAMPDSKAG